MADHLRPPPQRRRSSSFDAARESRRQRTFSTELTARLAADNTTSASTPTPASNTKLSPPKEPSPSPSPSGRRSVSFQPQTHEQQRRPPPQTSQSQSARSSPVNVLPLDSDDPEKGPLDLSPTRTNAPSLASGYFPPSHKWRTYFQQEIAHNHYLEAQLLALSFATGITDAVTTSNYSVFVSKQTGNTIYLALWAVQHPSVSGLERNVGLSIACFILGSVFFGHVGHAVRQRRRAWLLLNNAMQCMLVYGAVALAYAVPSGPAGPTTLAIIALLSVASGGQISLAICVKLPELNTTMITGALIQLATDRRIFALHNSARNRRLLFFASILGGAFVGAAAAAKVGPALGLLLNAVVKTVVCLSFFLNHGIVERPGPPGTPRDPASGLATPFNLVLWGD